MEGTRQARDPLITNSTVLKKVPEATASVELEECSERPLRRRAQRI